MINLSPEQRAARRGELRYHRHQYATAHPQKRQGRDGYMVKMDNGVVGWWAKEDFEREWLAAATTVEVLKAGL